MSEPNLSENPRRILLVEDQDAHVELARRGLEGRGGVYEIVHARTVEEARAAIAAGAPDLAIVDWILPDGPGIELVPEEGRDGPFPVVIMTSHGDEEFAVEAMKAGAIDYVVKSPEALADLARIADRALREWRLVLERRRAETDLRHLDERFRNLVESASDVIFTASAEGTIESLNNAFEAMIGMRREECVGRPFMDLVDDDDREQTTEVFRGALAGTTFPLVEIRIPSRVGGCRIVEFRIQRQMRGAEVIGLYGVGRDLTNRKRLEAELRQAQKMEAIGRLAGGLAHDFNNVLTVMLGCNEMLLLSWTGPEEDRSLLAEMRDSGWRAKKLIDQLLAFSRRQILAPAVLDLNSMIESMEQMVARLIGEDIQLEVRPGDDLGSVMADRGMVEQWILNLVVNARDAMPSGGRLVLEAGNVELDAQYVDAHPEARSGRYVVLSVTDTGEGISKDIQEQIFEPFFTTKGPGLGSGLGLSTVHGMVKQTGGHMSLQTEVGKGTSFHIYLPRVDALRVAEDEPLSEEPFRHQGSETVLVVEDETPVRNIAVRGLEQAGYTVLAAAHPAEALEIAENEAGRIDLLLTDVVMPGMNGREVADAVLRLRPDIRVLFMSGYTNSAIVRHGVLDEDVNFLRKPFTLVGLAQKAAEVLAGPRAPASYGV